MTGPNSQLLVPRGGKFAAWAIFGACLFIGGAIHPSAAVAQPPPAQPPPSPGGDSEADAAKTELPSDLSLTDPITGKQLSGAALAERIHECVTDLRSEHFADRELASEQLFRFGHDILPVLRSRRKAIADPEQSDRLSRIIESLSEQGLESRIRSFLRGGPAELDNWPELEKWFGDSPRVRELFVDLYREHPYLVKSLGGSPQELSVGLALVRRRLGERGVMQREAPQRLDLLALLLPMTEPKFQGGAQYDFLVASMLQSYPANEFRGDVVFGEPFMRMIETWMARSDLSSRERVLHLALQWDLDIGLKLAVESLNPPLSPMIASRAMQVISKRGNRENAPLLLPFLNDPTVILRRRSTFGPRGSDVQVGDVTAATIAALYGVPVTKLGFSEPAEHERLGIIFEELVVPLYPLERSVVDRDSGDSAAPGSDETKHSDSDQDDQAKANGDDPEGDDPNAPPKPPMILRDRLGRRIYTPEELAMIEEDRVRRDKVRVEIRNRARTLITGTDEQPKFELFVPQAPGKAVGQGT